MTFTLPLSLLSIIPVFTLAARLSLQPSLHLLSQSDQCSDDSSLPVESDLCSSPLDVIGDPRFVSYDNATQCRSLCQDQAPSFLRPSVFDVDCDICKNETIIPPYMAAARGNVNLCIPRHVCIDKCGPEQGAGCIYTGSCASQICFHGSNSNKTAQIKRYTHSGPGTVVLVDNTEGPANSTISSTLGNNPGVLPMILSRGGDHCTDSFQRQLVFGSSKNCSQGPLSDGREDAKKEEQCRVACKFFDYAPYEVVRISANCNFCRSSAADGFYSQGPNGKPHICIPRATCIEKCGPEGYGCVYTGSCLSRMCFSGVDSKQPAIFTALSDNGRESELFVDNSGDPVDADPPVFGPLGRQGNGTSLPPSQLSPTPFSSPEPSTPNLTPKQPGPSSGDTQPIWVWLGPVIGAGTIAFVIAVGLIVFAVRRRQAQDFEPVALPMHMLPSMEPIVHTRIGHSTAYSLPSPTTPVLTTPPITPRRL